MSCILGQDANGNRFIACRRGDYKRSLHIKEDSKPVECPHSFPSGTRVKHKTLGVGIVTRHSKTSIWVDFMESGVRREYVVEFTKMEIIQ